jgi:Ca-activated chloride channel family protein
MSLDNFMHSFHFLRPLWLLALPVLWGLVFWLARRNRDDSAWSGFIDAELLTTLRLDEERITGIRPWPLLALVWSITAIALAGPSWQRDQAPAYRASAAWVFVLDLSPSMELADVAPDRVTRARYALDDLLNAAHDARVGLVVFSEEPYTVTPLTQDIATVKALLPPLKPGIMPSPGDHLAPALKQAAKLLEQGGAKDQRIVVLTDGFDDPAAALSAAAAIKEKHISLSIVGIGTTGGAPQPSASGGFVQDKQGRALMARLDRPRLQQLAKTGGGSYVDIAQLPSLLANMQAASESANGALAVHGVQVAQWRDAGIWLLPLLLILAAFLARKDWL